MVLMGPSLCKYSSVGVHTGLLCEKLVLTAISPSNHGLVLKSHSPTPDLQQTPIYRQVLWTYPFFQRFKRDQLPSFSLQRHCRDSSRVLESPQGLKGLGVSLWASLYLGGEESHATQRDGFVGVNSPASPPLCLASDYDLRSDETTRWF